MHTDDQISGILSGIFPLKTDEDQDDLTSKNLEIKMIADCVKFSLSEGMNLEKADHFVKFFYNFLKETVYKSLPVQDTTLLLETEMKKFAMHSDLSILHLYSCIDYLMTTLIQHYHLIEYVICTDRSRQIFSNEQIIDIPDGDISDLKHATQICAWNLKTRLKAQEKQFQEKDEELNKTFELKSEELQLELEELLSSVDTIEDVQSLTSLQITDMITDIIMKQKQATSLDIEKLLERSKILLEFNFEKALTKSLTRDVSKKSKRT